MEQAADWYLELAKPIFAPPAWIFGPVWTLLYILIAISFGTMLYVVLTKRLPWIVIVPFVLNLVFNFLFSPIQFGLQNNVLALIDIVLVDATLIWAIVAIWKRVRWVAYANIPYLVWVLFATVLQVSITILNA